MKNTLFGSLIVLFTFVFSNAYFTSAQESLLENSGLEEPYLDGVAQGWQPWFEDSMVKKDCATEVYYAQPVWQPELFSTGLVVEGVRSQQVGNQWDPWRGGIMQTVDGAIIGQRYQFEAKFYGRVSTEQWPAASNDGYLSGRVGIDPTGNGDFSAETVVWGNVVTPRDSWHTAEVDVVASSSTISLFIEGDFGAVNNCYPHLNMWFDDTSLEAITLLPPSLDQNLYLPSIYR